MYIFLVIVFFKGRVRGHIPSDCEEAEDGTSRQLGGAVKSHGGALGEGKKKNVFLFWDLGVLCAWRVAKNESLSAMQKDPRVKAL